jgi:hypothetical protein
LNWLTLLAFILGAALSIVLAASIAGLVGTYSSAPVNPVARRRLRAIREGSLSRALLACVGILMAAMLYYWTNSRVRSADPWILLARETSSFASGSFTLSGPERLAAFPEGEGCSTALHGATKGEAEVDVKNLVSQVRRKLEADNEVMLLIVGSHDVRPLRNDALRTYRTNHTLAQSRAECVRAAIERGLSEGVSHALLTRVRALLVPAGAIHVAADRTPGEADLEKDRQTQVFILSWNTSDKGGVVP